MSMSAETSIARLIDAITLSKNSSDCLMSFAQATNSLKSLDESFLCVATINDLPAACDNTGRFVYVQSTESFKYSDGYEWIINACSTLANKNTATSLWTWGCNNNGQLGIGIGNTSDTCSPRTIIGGGTNWCQVSAGEFHTTAIKTNGTLWTWGGNVNGQLGNGSTISRFSPGTVAGEGSNWCEISSSGSHNVAIKCDGTLWTWGNSGNGRLGDGGSVTADKSSPGTVAGGGSWIQGISANTFSMAIKNDGTLWTWGNNNQGRLGDGTTLFRSSPGTVAGGGTNWCIISGGGGFSAGIKCDGTLWTWGDNTNGVLGDGTTVSRSSPGTVAGAGTTWCQIAITSGHGFATKCDGTIWTWGCNSLGKLGEGTTLNRSSPGTVAGGGTTWCQVCGGGLSFISAAVKTDGTLWTWGPNTNGILGDGTTLNRCSPGTIAGDGITWCSVNFGRYHVIGLKSRGF